MLWLASLPILLSASTAAADVAPAGDAAAAVERVRDAGNRISPATSDVPHDLRLVQGAELGVTVVQIRLDRRHPSLSIRRSVDTRPRLRTSWLRAARWRSHSGVLGDSRCAEDTAFDATPPPFPPRAL